MNFTLTRTEHRSDGVFSDLVGDDGTKFRTLEHAYQSTAGNWWPKIPDGTYTCVRGQHRLSGMTEDFTTFEVTEVAGHSNLLFHWGNFDRDSEGCVLVGRTECSSDSGEMVTSSKDAFAAFMALQDGCQTFQLTVVN